MRRLILTGLLFTLGCSTDGPDTVAYLQVGTDASPLGVFTGDKVQLTPYPFDINGSILAASVSYSSSNPGIATVTSAGLISTLAAGTTTITVSSGHINLNLPLQVDGNVPSAVIVSPSNPVVPKGTTQVLAAAIQTTVGNPARSKTVIWSTADATKVGVDQNGLASAIASTTVAGVNVCAAVSDAPTVKGCITIVVP
jgi:Bacterial Ig-like domain (group 2)